MNLILWRHAEAESGGPDAERKLTGRGRKQSKRGAEWLKERLKGRYVLLVSPTARTRETAKALTGEFEESEDIGPEANGLRIVKASGWPEAKGTVIVVGHRPGLNRAAALLMSGREREWEIKKGGLWWFEARPEGEPAFVRAVLAPKDF